MSGNAPSSDLQRILVRGVNWLGDAVMTTPALLRLRERFPRAHITLLTPEKLAGLWAGHPAIDSVVTFAPGESVFSVGRKLRGNQCDLALVLPNSPRSAFECRLARIPRRVGYARPWRNWLLTQAIPPRPGSYEMHKPSPGEIRERLSSRAPASFKRPTTQAHQIHEYLHLAAALGVDPRPVSPRLEIIAEELRAAVAKFSLGAVEKSGTPLLGLNPGAEYGPAKRWPLERFVATARDMQQRAGCDWVIFGGPNDRPMGDYFEKALRHPERKVHNLAGRTSLRELLAVLKKCRALLTNDSGPMHVAAALGTPVVVPFGSTSPELTGPGLPGDASNFILRAEAPCSPCFLRECPIDFRCMTGITSDQVTAALLKVLGLI